MEGVRLAVYATYVIRYADVRFRKQESCAHLATTTRLAVVLRSEPDLFRISGHAVV